MRRRLGKGAARFAGHIMPRAVFLPSSAVALASFLQSSQVMARRIMRLSIFSSARSGKYGVLSSRPRLRNQLQKAATATAWPLMLYGLRPRDFNLANLSTSARV